MTALLLSTSILIILIAAIRATVGNHIGCRARYALWLLVALRLALPFDLPKSPVSVMNYLPSGSVEAQQKGTDTASFTSGAADRIDLTAGPAASADPADTLADGSVSFLPGSMTSPARPAPAASALARIPLHAVWLTGSVLMGLYLLGANLLFYRRLVKTRVLFPVKEPLRVYCCETLASPCLFGLLRPSIYLGEAVLSDEKSYSFALAHELQHARHLDHIWCLVRSACLVVYWFHPLVWLAAVLSQRDCELACDEGVTARLSKEECTEYGRCLLNLTPCRRSGVPFTASTSMSGDARQLRRRLLALTKRKKTTLWAVLMTVVLLTAVVACTFTGAGKNKASAPGVPVPEITVAASSAQAVSGTPNDPNASQQSGTSDNPAASQQSGNNLRQTPLRAYTVFPDGTYGWALTEDCVILHTVSGAEQFYAADRLEISDGTTDAPQSSDTGSPRLLAENTIGCCFLDQKNAYFAGLCADSEELLFIHEQISSTEGNADSRIQTTQSVTAVPVADYDPSGTVYISFADTRHGYLLYCSGPALGMMAKTLYYTADGGESFSLVCDLSGLIAGYPTGFSFCGGQTGYLAITYHGENHCLYRTDNGGQTWEDLSLTFPDADIRYADAYPPVFYRENSQKGALILKAVGETVRYLLYQTEDAASREWTFSGVLPCSDTAASAFLMSIPAATSTAAGICTS